MPDASPEQQNRIIALADQINRVIAGMPTADAHTALTLAITTAIVSTYVEPEQRMVMVDRMAESVRDFLRRDDIVDWINRHIRRVHPGGHA